MKFKSRVAVQRNGATAYWTNAAVALRMCKSGFAARRGQGAIELPGDGSIVDSDIKALTTFDEAKPVRHCFGAHTNPNQDRMTFAPCFYRAATGTASGARIIWHKPAQHETSSGKEYQLSARADSVGLSRAAGAL